MTFKLPKIIAHRGASGYAPENTLEAIYTAYDMGLDWVEIDISLTRDDVPILLHDDFLDRTTNGNGVVAAKNWNDIKQLEAGSWFGDSFAGLQIPTLEQALEVIMELGLGLDAELKAETGREEHMTEAALDIISQYWEGDNIMISSSSPACLDTAHNIAQDYKRLWVLDKKWPENWQEIAQHLDLTAIAVEAESVRREDIEKLIDFGSPVLSYTVNQPDLLRKLQSWGVDGFFTDYPDIIQESLLTVH